MSFGDSLIKRVVETLQGANFRKLKTFATLSPIPGLRAWLAKNAAAAEQLTQARAELGRALGC